MRRPSEPRNAAVIPGLPVERPWTEISTLSPELRALLACARAVIAPQYVAGFRMILAECDNTERLCATAVAHGMIGHLHKLVASGPSLDPNMQSGSLPMGGDTDSILLSRLTDLQRLAAERSLRQTAHLIRVLTALSDVGVDAMPYKGPAGAQRLYGDVTRRTWADLDILVRYEQVARAREALLANGYIDANRFNVRILGRNPRGWGEIVLSLPGSGVYVEIHWEVAVAFSGRSLESGSLLSNADSMELLGRKVLYPSAVDLLLITCINGTKDRWESVEALLGLARQVRDTEPGTWGAVLAVAREAGCLRRVVVAVGNVCRALGLETPPEVIKLIAEDRRSRSLLATLAPDSLASSSLPVCTRAITTLRWRAATEDTLLGSFVYLCTRLFRPGPEDWEAFRLPCWAEWLCYPLRPLRLAVKWAKRL